MRHRVQRALALALLVGLALGAAAPQAQARPAAQASARYFPETGHAVRGATLALWQRTPNALFVLGYPIAEPFVEESFTQPGTFYRVQYFERAVLEEHPELAGTEYAVLGRLLGQQIAQGRAAEPAFQSIGDPGDGSYDPLSGHTLRDAPAPFRSFWLASGGLAAFGRPLSEQFQEVNRADGQTYWVQYFERQRMEWHPAEPDPRYRIQLGLLGSEQRDARHAGATAFAPLPPAVALAAPHFAYGFNAILYGQGTPWQDRGRALQLTREAGFGWVRQQVRWMDLHDREEGIHWGELDAIVADSAAAGVKLLLSVVAAPAWATPDGRNGLPAREHFADFNYFMGELARRYRGRVQAYEIWNEQNLAVENGGRVADAGLYMDLLTGASYAIKSADPTALVVSGALSATETNRPDIAISDITFSAQMFADPRFRAAVDVVGVHPGGQANPPDTLWPDRPGPGPGWVNSREFYFRRVEDVRAVMLAAGLADKPVWITEFGWATPNNTPGYGYGNQTSFETQAAYIARAFQIGRSDYAPWLTGMFLWQLNFAVPWRAVGNEQHEQASFGVLNGDWSPRPAYYAVQRLPKE